MDILKEELTQGRYSVLIFAGLALQPLSSEQAVEHTQCTYVPHSGWAGSMSIEAKHKQITKAALNPIQSSFILVEIPPKLWK